MGAGKPSESLSPLGQQSDAGGASGISMAGRRDGGWIAGEEELISLFDLWDILWRRKWLVLALILLSTLGSGVAALLMTPVYRAEAVLAPVTEEQGSGRYAAQLDAFGGIAALAGVRLGEQGSRKNEAIATLRSRALTEKFIEEEKLLPVLFHDRWDAENARWQPDDPSEIPDLWDAYELFDEKIRRIAEDRSSGLVTLSVDWEDPDLAARWANELVRRANRMLSERSTAESQSAINYMQAQLKQTRAVELKQVLNEMIESEMKQVILANINEEFAFRLIDPAVPPGEPHRPRPVQMLAVGAVLGAVAGVLLALVLGFASDRGPTGRPAGSLDAQA